MDPIETYAEEDDLDTCKLLFHHFLWISYWDYIANCMLNNMFWEKKEVQNNYTVYNDIILYYTWFLNTNLNDYKMVIWVSELKSLEDYANQAVHVAQYKKTMCIHQESEQRAGKCFVCVK